MKLTCDRSRQQNYQDENGKRYWSVSEVLSVMDPNAFAGVDPYVMAAAQERGKDLHVLFGLRLLAEIGLAEMPARPSGIIGKYYDGIDKFAREQKPRAIRVEESSINDNLGIAGTDDTECYLENIDSIVDLKTGPARVVHAAQLMAYKTMKGREKVKRLYSLYIDKHWDYDLVPHKPDSMLWALFQSSLSVLHGRRICRIS